MSGNYNLRNEQKISETIIHNNIDTTISHYRNVIINTTTTHCIARKSLPFGKILSKLQPIYTINRKFLRIGSIAQFLTAIIHENSPNESNTACNKDKIYY